MKYQTKLVHTNEKYVYFCVLYKYQDELKRNTYICFSLEFGNFTFFRFIRCWHDNKWLIIVFYWYFIFLFRMSFVNLWFCWKWGILAVFPLLDVTSSSKIIFLLIYWIEISEKISPKCPVGYWLRLCIRNSIAWCYINNTIELWCFSIKLVTSVKYMLEYLLVVFGVRYTEIAVMWSNVGSL